MRKCFYGYSQNTTGPSYYPNSTLCIVTDVSPCFLPTSYLFNTPTCWELERLPWSCNCPVERRWWEKCQSQSEMRFFVHFVLQLIISLFSIHLWIFLVTEKSILFLSLSGRCELYNFFFHNRWNLIVLRETGYSSFDQHATNLQQLAKWHF